MKQEPKLPQNINNLLMEIGEKSTIFYLYLLTRKKKWNVYYNLNEVGCDIVLIESGTQRQLNIEVKSRQRLYTTGKNKGFHSQVTENEYRNIDFMIGYWFEKNIYFIVPKNKLKMTMNNSKRSYYLPIAPKKDGSVGGAQSKYVDNWKLIADVMGSRPALDIANVKKSRRKASFVNRTI